jgi:hypothetical protein
MVLLSLVLGVVFGIGGALLIALFEDAETNDEERKKLAEIRERLVPIRWREEHRAT